MGLAPGSLPKVKLAETTPIAELILSLAEKDPEFCRRFKEEAAHVYARRQIKTCETLKCLQANGAHVHAIRKICNPSTALNPCDNET